jgi:hypothetical protein
MRPWGSSALCESTVRSYRLSVAYCCTCASASTLARWSSARSGTTCAMHRQAQGRPAPVSLGAHPRQVTQEPRQLRHCLRPVVLNRQGECLPGIKSDLLHRPPAGARLWRKAAKKAGRQLFQPAMFGQLRLDKGQLRLLPGFLLGSREARSSWCLPRSGRLLPGWLVHGVLHVD